MFTGIVEAIGKVHRVEFSRSGASLGLRAPASFRKLKLGASICVDGVCLTVSEKKAPIIFFDVVPETLNRTWFRGLKAGDLLNLERPLPWKGRVDGHLVQGHVDGVVKVLKKINVGKGADFKLAASPKFSKSLKEKGSVALNGISLTIGKKEKDGFWIHGIPHTVKKTNMGLWMPGQLVNLELDFMLRR